MDKKAHWKLALKQMQETEGSTSDVFCELPESVINDRDFYLFLEDEDFFELWDNSFFYEAPSHIRNDVEVCYHVLKHDFDGSVFRAFGSKPSSSYGLVAMAASKFQGKHLTLEFKYVLAELQVDNEKIYQFFAKNNVFDYAKAFIAKYEADNQRGFADEDGIIW